MAPLRSWIIGFFGFSRTETNAFLIMVPLMVTLVFSAPVYRWWLADHQEIPEPTVRRLDSLIATWTWGEADTPSVKPQAYFPFDPNTASVENLVKLGLSDKLSERIVAYRAKGGKFKIKRDLLKIYGMDSALCTKLLPFIKLPDKIRSPKPPVFARFEKKIIPRFDLNLADTSQLINIYGIGKKLSLRITAYRSRLGGFISIDQLREVYGLDTTVINRLAKQSFIRPDFNPRKININTADEKQLGKFPYVRFGLAKSIAVYRYQHGEFASIDDIRKIALMDEPTFQKIKPYISVKDSL